MNHSIIKKLNTHRHFTLIELLVVIAIIAIIASMILPVLRRAREQARIAICSANQKQLYIGMYTYANDNGQYIPIFPSRPYQSDSCPQSHLRPELCPSGYWSNPCPYTCYYCSHWGKLISQYTHEPFLLMCPSLRMRLKSCLYATYYYSGTFTRDDYIRYTAYAYVPNLVFTYQNHNIVGCTGTRLSWRVDQACKWKYSFGGPWYLGQPPKPWSFSNMVIFNDGIANVAGDSSPDAGNSKTNHTNARMKRLGGNVCRGDGSVKWFVYDRYHW